MNNKEAQIKGTRTKAEHGEGSKKERNQKSYNEHDIWVKVEFISSWASQGKVLEHVRSPNLLVYK